MASMVATYIDTAVIAPYISTRLQSVHAPCQNQTSKRPGMSCCPIHSPGCNGSQSELRLLLLGIIQKPPVPVTHTLFVNIRGSIAECAVRRHSLNHCQAAKEWLQQLLDIYTSVACEAEMKFSCVTTGTVTERVVACDRNVRPLGLSHIQVCTKPYPCLPPNCRWVKLTHS